MEASDYLQWRDRDGLSPSSLLFLAETQSYATIRMAFISPPLRLVNCFLQRKNHSARFDLPAPIAGWYSQVG